MRKKVLAFLLALAFCLLFPVPALANSAEPPRLSVVVENPPQDLKLSLVFSRNDQREPVTAEAHRLAWEGYYLFRPSSFPSFAEMNDDVHPLTVELLAETGGESFSVPVETETLFHGPGSYNTRFTLDLSTRSLNAGQPWWRQPLLVFLRVASTLLLEGLVFLLCGYRQKRSWVVFLLVNLVTQLFVNLVLLFLVGPFGNMGYVGLILLFLYLPMELVVLAVELIAYRRLLREKTKLAATLTAIVANLVSWVLGGTLLTYLPI